ncbi:Gfo/Idh/MocA family protein [Aureliella helgolandensis]|uniref:Inositol 2-dehydrogenase n=1 Tax=Aureliella helgolandensis TaxID=2527968 RepID=A0A518GG84_9BACT|nr:Gfo/Idh/MocA family oxidoreductase [Aureliella helgolandensis]QDV27593.1 Inositol 2-dehydrogenase [Aureliella helgolandensis]
MLPRRHFVASGAALAATTHTLANAAQTDSSDLKPVRIGVMGLSRGQSLALDFGQMPSVTVKYLCDIDERRAVSAVNQFKDKVGVEPQSVVNFLEILDDPEIDALVCAAPNHWHAPATLLACKAGKHVYVEKPCSHNPLEGEWMVAAGQKYNRCVQMGSQRRSAARTQEAMKRLHSGAIGNVHLARCYYNNLRGSIGHGAEATPPKELNYELWQGPAPRRPYRDNLIPYNWHWVWHYGGGELANNGVHALDLCRWGLDVDYPIRAVSSGGRYWFDDDQETPDVQTAAFEFEGGKRITWDALSCNKHRVNSFCEFYGDAGALELDSDGAYRIFDLNDKQIEEGGKGSVGQKEHLQNFVDAIRADDPSLLNQPILEGHKSTLLCHLGNIAYRTDRVVHCDSTNGHIVGDEEQQAMWRRDYAAGWEDRISMS